MQKLNLCMCKWVGFSAHAVNTMSLECGGKGGKAAEHWYVLFKPYRTRRRHFTLRKTEIYMFQREVGFCLLIHLFIYFNRFFCLLMVIKYLKGLRSQFPLASCAVPYYKPCAWFYVVLFNFLFICSFFVYCRIAMSWRRWTWKSAFWWDLIWKGILNVQ